ncbi:MAG: hypothetical protein EA391_10285 [Balneolaceae bacterium]|nr:MAG: hypothetical protein EA391_10285 [Balneolaceae bacterium]
MMDENIINDLNDELESVIEEGHSMLRDAQLEEKFNEIKTEAELLVRKHPITSVVVGAAVGYLIGKIFR